MHSIWQISALLGMLFGSAATTAVDLPVRVHLDAEQSEVAVLLDDHYKAAIRNPESGLNRGRLAMAYEINGFPAEAIATYQQAEALAPDQFHWPYFYAVLEHRSGKPEAALGGLDRALSIDDEYAPAWLWRGQVLNDLGRHEHAAEAYRRAIDLNMPVFGSIGLARALLSDARPADALGVLEPLAQIADSTEVFHLLALAYDRLALPEESRLASMRKGTTRRTWPDEIMDLRIYYLRDPIISLQYGIERVAEGDYDQAIRILESLRERRGHHRDLLDNLARAYAEVGQFAPAFEVANEGLAHHPDHVPFHYYIARLYVHRQDAESALRHLHRATELDRGHAPSQELLGTILSGRQRYREALIALNASGTSEAMYYAGMIEGAQQRWPESIGYFERAIAGDPTCRKCYYYMGQSLGEAGRYADARRALTRARELADADDPSALEQR